MKLGRLITMCLNESCSKVHIVKHLYDAFSIQNGMEQGDGFQLYFRMQH